MYYPQTYKSINLERIKNDALKEGFQVTLIKDRPGFVYEPHTHPQIKYLVFVSGSMNVTVDGKTYKCKPGDKLIIEGNTKHAGVVGSKGCEFFWSEKAT